MGNPAKHLGRGATIDLRHAHAAFRVEYIDVFTTAYVSRRWIRFF